jgi:hypothetical protein
LNIIQLPFMPPEESKMHANAALCAMRTHG